MATGRDWRTLDENGRSDLNVSRAFDCPRAPTQRVTTSTAAPATDRPHTLKLFGNYTHDWKLVVERGPHPAGLQQDAAQFRSDVHRSRAYNGRGDLGRTDTFYADGPVAAPRIPRPRLQPVVARSVWYSTSSIRKRANVTTSTTETGVSRSFVPESLRRHDR